MPDSGELYLFYLHGSENVQCPGCVKNDDERGLHLRKSVEIQAHVTDR